jgi:hypothetical protein
MKNRILATLLVVLTLFSCTDDKDSGIKRVENGKYLLLTMVPKPGGQTGSSHMQLIGSLKAKAYDNSNSFNIPFSTLPLIFGNQIYVLPGWGNETDVLKRYTNNNGLLVENARVTLDEASGALNLVEHGDKIYVSYPKRGEIAILDKESLKITNRIDVTKYAHSDNNPDPSCMVIRDNLLYVGLNQMVGQFSPDPARAKSDVLIIDTKTDKVVKMITESESGISQPTRPLDPKSIFVDENNDIYVVGLSAFGMIPTHKAGVLRIKSGETDFDPNYKFVAANLEIEGEDADKKMNVLWNVQYAGNGRLFATANIAAYGSTPPDYLNDKTVICVEMDLKKQTIKKLDIPRSNSYAVSCDKIGNYIVFGLATEEGSGFYYYDLNTNKVVDGIQVGTEGYPYRMVETGI